MLERQLAPRVPAAGKLTAYLLDGHAENFVRLKAPSIEIVATLPGEPLYATFAYTGVERFAIALPNGTTLPVVRMRKLPAPPPPA